MFRILRNSVRVPLLLVCPQCDGQMRIIAALTDHAGVDRIINDLKLAFVAKSPRLLNPSIKNSWWPQRLRMSAFRDSLLDREERSA